MRYVGKTLDRLLKRNVYVFLLFYLTTLLAYFESRWSGFVTDYIGFEQNYDKCGFWHYYTCAGNKNFRYLQHAISYPLYKIVGSESIAWYILYTLAHALTSYIFFLLLKKLFFYVDQQKYAYLAFLAAYLFLLSPYQSEVVVWRVCIQYNTTSICLLLSMLFYIKDLEKPRMLYPLLCLLLFIVGLLSLEQIVVMPYFIIVVALFYSIRNRTYALMKRTLLFYFIPQHLLLAGYFLASKIVYGKWIMHYGVGVYQGIFSIQTISKIFKYFFKYVFLVRYWKHEYKEAFLLFLERPSVTITLTMILLLLTGYLLRKFILGSLYSGILLLLIGLYVVSLVPVIELYFTYVLYSANDRLGYLSSMFIFGIVALVVYKFTPLFKYTIFLLLILVNFFFLVRMSHYWMRSTQIYNGYLEAFHAYPYKTVYLLGVPDNYRGLWMMTIVGPSSGFKEALEYRKKQKYTGNMYDVMQYNATSFEDGMGVEKRDDSTLYVHFTHNGSWFIYQGLGARDYETPQYKVHMTEWGYTVQFKNFNKENDVILYPYKLQWKQADL